MEYYSVLELKVFCQLIQFHCYVYFHIIFPIVSPQRLLMGGNANIYPEPYNGGTYQYPDHS